MGIWVVLAIAAALAMDAFAVALVTGVTLKSVSARQTFRLAWHFGLFQALTPIAGWSIGLTVHSLIEKIDHWVAFALLAFVGFRMITEAVKKNKGEVEKPDPTKAGTLIVLSVATSIDALAVGFSLSLIRVSMWWPALVIGLVAGLFAAIGHHLGGLLGTGSRLGRFAELIGGLVLLGIGVKILFEHGIFSWLLRPLPALGWWNKVLLRVCLINFYIVLTLLSSRTKLFDRFFGAKRVNREILYEDLVIK